MAVVAVWAVALECAVALAEAGVLDIADLRLAAGMFTLQALTSGHGATFLLAAGLVLVGCRLVLGEPPAVVRRLRDLACPACCCSCRRC